MTIKESATEIYDTLQALHDAVGDTPEMIAHHGALNTLRQLLGMTWGDFLVFIGETPAPMAMKAPGGGTTNVGGAGGKDD